MAINVLLYEDNDMLRESVVSLLRLHAKYESVTAFSNVTSVADQVKELRPDIILMDIDMPGGNGIEAVRLIRRNQFAMPVIMLTVFDDNENVLNAIRAGASGYLLKQHISSKLFSSIDEALSGGAPMSPTVARMVLNAMQGSQVVNPYNLTSREQEILGLLSKGNSYKLIAIHLDISIDTVRTHIKKIYEKMHVHSQTEAVSKAINEKLV
ncbi:MAG TPA: response regulator transcription factor [Chryseosolibacter sp.]|nr:response regulator transcription factor [Chryseosolibacter sp.]